MDGSSVNKGGRPPVEFNWELFDKLCALPSIITQEEIADMMNVSVDTCVNKIKQEHGDDASFSGYRDKKHAGFRTSLLSEQYAAAKKGNAAMLIWLGKQYLGQSDKSEVSIPRAEIKLNYSL